MKSGLVVSAVSMLLLSAVSTASAVEVRYEVRFEATWSAETHPQDFPPTPHFSPPIGGVHNSGAVFWTPGELASLGVKRVAELGQTTKFSAEILDEAALGNASFDLIEGAGLASPGQTTTEFVATPEFPLVTYITMIAPSPDWFAGVHGLELLAQGHWRDDLVVPLAPYDAGTDGGTTFLSPDVANNPPQPISLIQTPPLATDGYAPPIGSYHFRILEVDGLAPYDDADGDGLTNLFEAELGTDPQDPDTDGDSVGDASDNCPLDADSTQADLDLDQVGDVCDNCPAQANATQSDFDGDAEGDACDLDDGLLWFTAMHRGSQTWQEETSYSGFHLYRGDLEVLKNGGDYTQDPAAPNAEQFCGLPSAFAADTFEPAPGVALFYLVTGVNGAEESPLGPDGQGLPRPNAHPCGN